jgi:hypothetical protein
MVWLQPGVVHRRCSRLSHSENSQKKKLQGSTFAFTAIAALITISASISQRTPVRTSILTGQLWLAELYTSPEVRS